MSLNRSWLLARRPEGAVQTDDFAYHEEAFEAPRLDKGEILVRTRIISCAPTIRNWLNPPERSYRGAIGIGEPIKGMAAVEVLASRHARFEAGQWATAVAPWQDYAVLRPDAAVVPVTPIEAWMDPVDAMTLYSPNSLTAYFGLFSVGEPKPGMTVLVSGAAGSVGAMVCQMARIAGCRVIAVAGGPEKCRWLEEEVGADIAIDYRSTDFSAALKDATPAGVNIFFDNVGGDVMHAAIGRMAPHGRVVLCGQLSAYDSNSPAAGPRDMMKLVYGRIRIQGFVVGDYADEYASAIAAIRQWEAEGRLRNRYDMRDGFHHIPDAFVDIFQGRNSGTLIVRI
ncbi:MAG: NADP-dependent oxidoreductase [Pseudomonadota bacterium]|uniref:NADP-dependent oxidoreductase n=1 Tax=Sphingobium xenophagum TaxID=121428 RepID=A0A249MSS7_SPHXE|nr:MULTISPECIES: NADP-dependent oxidoreductase [Sphingobium]ASY44187.1 NADP-dependent oxidoreductase [Sphingobium xenophagum]OUC56268.1 NADP-dependent oxidoreductase [Sphingobium sp. GW456-12-10-14-TSB1]QWT15525.1 NADP-dependent oxidoreductase [Sphingobium xenophagum]|tara:strand:- start:528 stop:1544 length:1017 start_codon:yes stop_codon:yes gene_type:complete